MLHILDSMNDDHTLDVKKSMSACFGKKKEKIDSSDWVLLPVALAKEQGLFLLGPEGKTGHTLLLILVPCISAKYADIFPVVNPRVVNARLISSISVRRR